MKYIKQILLLAIAIFLFSFSFNLFQVENGLVTGGVTGIVLILNGLFALDIPRTTLLINASFLILGLLILGRTFFLKTILGSLFFYPFFLSVIPVTLVFNNIFINVIACGLFMGVGIFCLLLSGGSSGGTSLICRILIKYTNIPFPKGILLIDGSIIICGFFMFGLQNGILSLMIVFISTNTARLLEKKYNSYVQVCNLQNV